MKEPTSSKNDFEQLINRSYDIAIKHQHEYVVLEHVLKALLEFKEIDSMLQTLNTWLALFAVACFTLATRAARLP